MKRLVLIPLCVLLMAFTPTEYEREVAMLPDSFLEGGCPQTQPPFPEHEAARWRLVHKYSWSIITADALDRVSRFIGGRKVVDFGSGNGYWSYLLARHGLDVLAIDDWREGGAEHVWFPVETGSFEKLENTSGRVLVLSWPPRMSPMALTALQRWGGDRLVYAGEILRGTADPAFHRELAANWRLVERVTIPQWRGRGDAIFLFERAPGNGVGWDWVLGETRKCWP